MQCLGEITTSNKIRKSLQELAYVNRGTMQVEQAFGENSNRDDAAAQNWPHQQAALLDVINHADFSNALSQLWQANNLRLSAAPQWQA
jgi:glucose-6-phosphate-specific signal transduction histidine kinase